MDSSNQQTDNQTSNRQLLANWEDLGLGLGFVIENIDYNAIKVAKSNGETPYVAFSPHNSEKSYLLSIIQLNSTKQLLRPATIQDLETSAGVRCEVIKYFEVKDFTGELEMTPELVSKSVGGGAGPGLNVVEKTLRMFSNVAVVALIKQIVNPETGISTLRIEPSATHIIEKVELCKSDIFVRLEIRCPGIIDQSESAAESDAV